MNDVTDNDATTDGQWLTLPSAAAQLGVSERTLTRRIASSQFRAERFDGRVRVWLPNSNGHVTANPVSTADSVAEMTDTTTELSVTLGQAIELLKDSLGRERERSDAERQRAKAAEARVEAATTQMLKVEQHVTEAREMAAMYQERSRNLEEENKRLHAQLALPPPRPTAPWWAVWRRGS